MPTTQYLAFGTNTPGTANSLTYAAYSALTTLRANGFLAGIALSEQVNTVLRQATTGVAGVAKFATDYGLLDCLDDRSPANFALAIKSAIDALISTANAVDTGDIKATIINAAGPGWLKCNGQAVSRTTYAGLFAAIGVTYGVGNGTTTFNVPDLRAEFLRGWVDGRSGTTETGRILGSAQADAFKAHTHTLPLEAGGGSNAQSLVDTNNVDEGPYGSATGSTGDTETRPRNVAVLFLIKT